MMRKMKSAAILLLAAASVSAMGRQPPKQEEPAPAAPTEKKMPALEWKSQQGGPFQRAHLIAYDQATWKSVWRELGQDAPEADFDKYAAVVVYVGEKMTGGYTAVFQEPAAQGDDLLVRYTIPAPAGFTTQAITHPWKVRLVPKPKGRVILEYVKP